MLKMIMEDFLEYFLRCLGIHGYKFHRD